MIPFSCGGNHKRTAIAYIFPGDILHRCLLKREEVSLEKPIDRVFQKEVKDVEAENVIIIIRAIICIMSVVPSSERASGDLLLYHQLFPVLFSVVLVYEYVYELYDGVLFRVQFLQQRNQLVTRSTPRCREDDKSIFRDVRNDVFLF